jgi:hypothetical protein
LFKEKEGFPDRRGDLGKTARKYLNDANNDGSERI